MVIEGKACPSCETADFANAATKDNLNGIDATGVVLDTDNLLSSEIQMSCRLSPEAIQQLDGIQCSLVTMVSPPTHVRGMHAFLNCFS